MEFLEAKKIMEQKMGDWKIMALASCEDNYPMVRNVSCLFYNDKIYFKTDKNFRKTQQLFKNNRVAMCFNGTQVTPEFVEIWDEDEDRKAFQLFIDFKKKTVEYKPYD
jgi:uncharacterized pyridoxamine 5'-phosphate oxidase family protein